LPKRIGATELQRSRLIAATVTAIETNGYRGVRVADVLTRARISRKTFYEIFDDLEDCFLATFERTVDHVRELMRAAFLDEPGWRDGVRAALWSLLTLIEQERGLARICVVDALGAGPRVLERRSRLLDELAQAIDGGRAVANAHRGLHPLTAQAIAGGVAALLHARLLHEDATSLTDLHGPLMSIIVLPYLGGGAAREELGTPSPPRKLNGRSAFSAREIDPLDGLEMRLTYRTVRVLSEIAEHPDATNVAIAEAAGIIDPGQVSKLLARLARLGLVENNRPGRGGRGENAWRLTDAGARIQHATSGVLL
jgi:AcrR family transcriptional regulator/DNA-binding MarR family transcriptional regulator